MLANIRIATIVGLMAIVVLVNAAELKTPREEEEEEKRLFWGWKPKPKPKPKPNPPSCGAKPPLSQGRVWANDWDGKMDFSCPHPGTAISSMFSVWSSCKRDRIWSFKCSTPSLSLAKSENSTWDLGFINEWDGCLVKHCERNSFICGMRSEHDNTKEDRRFKFKCCTAIPKWRYSKILLTGCEDVKLNDFQKKMDYTIRYSKVLQGLYSEHRNDKRDREWHAIICRVVRVRVRRERNGRSL